MQMEIIILVNGKTIKLMDMESIHIKMVLGIKAIGMMINKMEKEKKNGQMELNMKEIIN